MLGHDERIVVVTVHVVVVPFIVDMYIFIMVVAVIAILMAVMVVVDCLAVIVVVGVVIVVIVVSTGRGVSQGEEWWRRWWSHAPSRPRHHPAIPLLPQCRHCHPRHNHRPLMSPKASRQRRWQGGQHPMPCHQYPTIGTAKQVNASVGRGTRDQGVSSLSTTVFAIELNAVVHKIDA